MFLCSRAHVELSSAYQVQSPTDGRTLDALSTLTPGGTGMVYRYENGQLRYYPSPEIASSWNDKWAESVAVQITIYRRIVQVFGR